MAIYVPGAIPSSWPSPDVCVSSLVLSSKSEANRFLGKIGEFGSPLVASNAVPGEGGALATS